ncbi:hypothetical protein CEXT_598121 [Caerostris extrusa]|uniref:Uncharacterized protein n=1 Tax=Caerostris extrusa TaxID=172846 RepID=A0AAV4T689_CAEEX|nr:hypothetical protein CEXT_598121 [Caerostris extrusa]
MSTKPQGMSMTFTLIVNHDIGHCHFAHMASGLIAIEIGLRLYGIEFIVHYHRHYGFPMLAEESSDHRWVFLHEDMHGLCPILRNTIKTGGQTHN